MTNVIPEIASKRRIIAVLEQHEIDNLSRNGEVQLLTDPQTHILVYPLAASDDDQVLANILDSGLDRPNTILVQSPFDLNKYVDAIEARKDLALEKHFLFANFCHLLGAKKVSINQLEIHINEKVQIAKFNGGKPEISGGIEGKRTEADNISSEFSLIDEHPDNQPKLNEAEALLRSNRLRDDLNMRSLLQARKSTPNSSMKRNLTVNLSTEANKTLKVAGNLKLPIAKLSAEYESSIKENKEYKVMIEVVF